LVIYREEDVGGRDRVTTDEEQRSSQAVYICSLSGGESFIGKRKKSVFNAFTDFKPMWRFENRGGVTEFGNPNHSPGKHRHRQD